MAAPNKNEAPPSPPLSSTSTLEPSSPSPYHLPATQWHISVEDSLLGHGISLEDAERWKQTHNRQNIPIMHDDLFYKLVTDASLDAKPAELESKIESLVVENSACLQAEFEKTAYDIMVPGCKIFGPSKQIPDFIRVLGTTHSIHGFEAFIARYLPTLEEAL